MATINTNMAANIAANAMTRNERSMSQTMERLSTGIRINSAKDDAAGLAISSKMTSQIRGLNQGVRNANDAIGMIQVEEGAMKEVSNMLQRMRELAVQAISDSNTAADRDALDAEFTQLAAEIQRVGSNTQWNAENLIDGTKGASAFQIGANAGQTISHTFAQIKSVDVASQTHVEAQATNASDTGPVAEVQTLTLGGGAFAIGDTIAFKIDGIKFGAEVTGLDGTTIESVKVHGSSTTVSVDDSTTDNSFATTATAGKIILSMAADNVLTFTGTTTGAAAQMVVTSGSGLVKRGVTAGITAVDIDTSANAANAIKAVDVALTAVDSARATSGAVMNRLEFASDNLTNVAQNSASARSRIMDADYAAETTELARTQIIQQAATAMLAQANQSQQAVLALLR